MRRRLTRRSHSGNRGRQDGVGDGSDAWDDGRLSDRVSGRRSSGRSLDLTIADLGDGLNLGSSGGNGSEDGE
jgi:hypothetical protein